MVNNNPFIIYDETDELTVEQYKALFSRLRTNKEAKVVYVSSINNNCTWLARNWGSYRETD